MSRLVDFYRGAAADSKGRRLADIWDWDDAALEDVHDFIQWLFPLPEASQFNGNAPLLMPDDIAAFKADPILKANLRRSFERILAFLGLALTDDGHVVEGPAFAARRADVWDSPNHNWLRITRIVRSLLLLGLKAEAEALYARLKRMYESGCYPIGTDTLRYWTDAAEGRMPGG
jgi:hypothetical protein